MTKLSDILTTLFTNAVPCSGCRRAVPTYADRGTGRCYCLECLETAVEEAQAEMMAERQDMAMIACFNRQLAA